MRLNAMTAGSRIAEIDTMRSIAIIVILLHHSEIDQRVSWLHGNLRYLGLGVFVFLSGYLLPRVEALGTSFASSKMFMLRRYVRIFPLYWVALACFVAMFGEVRQALSPQCLLVHVLGLQLIFSSRSCDPVVTLWYVGLVVTYYWYYLVHVRCNGRWAMELSWLCVFALSLAMITYQWSLSDKRLLLYLPVFLFGIYARRLVNLHSIGYVHGAAGVAVLAGVMSLYHSVIYPFIFGVQRRPSLLSGLTLAALGSIVIMMFASVLIIFAVSKALSAWLPNGLFAYISTASYAMYLFHRPFWFMLTRIYEPQGPLAIQLYLVVVGIPLLCVVSYWMQRLCDAAFAPVLARSR